MNIENVKNILADTLILLKSAEVDFKNKEYSSYKDYLEECNELVNKLKNEKLLMDIEILQKVPEGKQATYGIGSHAEIAKHREIINTLKKIISRNKDFVELKHTAKLEFDNILIDLFNKFHNVARQLRSRYNSRSTIEIEDEYDVQDLLHALLKLNFDDIRAEENTPSYAGGSKRVDFLLKNEKTLIEVKKTRKSLSDKEVGEQLIVDVACYKVHPDCEKLYCFVYDPEGRIGNPIGLENDLNKLTTEDLEVKVFIFPK